MLLWSCNHKKENTQKGFSVRCYCETANFKPVFYRGTITRVMGTQYEVTLTHKEVDRFRIATEIDTPITLRFSWKKGRMNVDQYGKKLYDWTIDSAWKIESYAPIATLGYKKHVY